MFPVLILLLDDESRVLLIRTNVPGSRSLNDGPDSPVITSQAF